MMRLPMAEVAAVNTSERFLGSQNVLSVKLAVKAARLLLTFLLWLLMLELRIRTFGHGLAGGERSLRVRVGLKRSGVHLKGRVAQDETKVKAS